MITNDYVKVSIVFKEESNNPLYKKATIMIGLENGLYLSCN